MRSTSTGTLLHGYRLWSGYTWPAVLASPATWQPQHAFLAHLHDRSRPQPHNQLGLALQTATAWTCKQPAKKSKEG